jgi:LysM repeat protein
VCKLAAPCPFEGCDFFGLPDDIELHTPGCVHALRYSMSLIVEATLEATQGKAGGVELTAEAYATVMRIAENARSAAASAPSGPNDSVRHYIQSADNLQGVAVKYETTVQEIKRLNRLTSNNLFARQWIWVRTHISPPHTHSHSLTHTRTHTHTHTHTHAHTHTRAHTHAHTHTFAHTHSLIPCSYGGCDRCRVRPTTTLKP